MESAIEHLPITSRIVWNSGVGAAVAYCCLGEKLELEEESES